MTERLADLHDLLMRHPARVVAGCVLAAAVGAIVAVATLRLDLSFRPLFADDAAALAATADFEARFGEPSGAHVGILIRREEGLTPALAAVLGKLSAELAALPYVTDVLGPGRLAVPRWSESGVTVEWLIDPLALAFSAEAADSAAARLRRDPAEADAFVRDGGRTLLVLVRTGLPLSDLPGRTRLVRRISGAAGAALPDDAEHHIVGVSAVEAAYAVAVRRGMERSLLLTTLAVAAMLLLVFGRLRDIVIVLAGVSVATPLTLGTLGVLGRDITLLGSMVPTIVLVIGAADAIHMRRRWQAERAGGEPHAAAVHRTFVALTIPCLLTTVTTAAGFLSLGAARVGAIRELGSSVALGVALVFVANMLLVPALLRLFGDVAESARRSDAGSATASSFDAPRFTRRGVALLERGAAAIADAAVATMRRPRAALAAALVAAVGLAAGVARLQVEQRFNEELAPGSPVRAGQAALERHFGGFLGPELEVRRTDGGAILDADGRAALRHAADRIAALPDVHRVHGPESLLDGAPDDAAVLHAGLTALAADSLLAPRVREVYDPASGRVALHVRLGDVGTTRALELAGRIAAEANDALGERFDTRLVGQWHLAQLGMASLLHDMLTSFALSLLLVLPLLGLALRSWRTLLVAIAPNLLPAAAALAWLGWTGTTLRIGTALVLAIALAIGVDDSIHLLVRARAERVAGRSPADAMRAALDGTGVALLLTTLVLAAGFLSMLTSDIAALRDMGAVAAVALLAALLADLFVLPPIYALVEDGPAHVRHRRRPTTSYARSMAPPRRATFEVHAGSEAEAAAGGGRFDRAEPRS